MKLYQILGIKSNCTKEEFEKAKNRFYSTAQRYSNISPVWVDFVNKHCTLIEEIGLSQYNKRVNMQETVKKETGEEIDIFDDSLFVHMKFTEEEVRQSNAELDFFNRKSKENAVKKYSGLENDKQKYKLERTTEKKNTKGLKKALTKVVAVVLAVTTLFVVIKVGSEIYKKYVVDNPDITVVETTTEKEVLEEEKILIDYKVELGDTKTKIVNKLDLSKESASRIPNDVFEGQVYKVYVNEDIAQEYNYNNKIIKTFLDTYELQSGGTLYEIASYVKDAYPEVFENMTIGEIKEQIARDNGCTTQDYQAKTYVINCYKTQAELDKLTEMGVISSGMQF